MEPGTGPPYDRNVQRILAAIVLPALLTGACVRGTEPPPEAAPSPPAPSAPADGRHHVVFDTDLAFDDIMALLYLLQRDDVAIDAVTITGTGEAHCDPGVENALRLLALGGVTDTPVACGRETPLQGTNAFPDEWRAAVDDLSMLDLPGTDGAADPRGATGLLLDTLDGDATLITLGPLTNVAEALRADPGLPSRVPSFFAMAGAIDVPGNTPGGVAEYNVWVDPLAAKEVFEAMDVTLVPLDATDDVPFTPFFADAFEDHLATPEAEAVHAIILANEPIFLESGYSFWDTLATALVFHPELATYDEAPVLVTASQDAGAGWIDRWDEGEPVRFAASVPDPLAFEREYLSVLTGEPVTEVRPEATISMTFDGDRCTLESDRLRAGSQVIAYLDERDAGSEAGILVEFSDRFTYEDMRTIIGADGSILPERTREPRGLRVLAFVVDLAEAQTRPSVLAGICTSSSTDGETVRVWLTDPVSVRR